MTKEYFNPDNKEVRINRRAELETEARMWIGTPFIAHSQVRGAGVDCVHLAAAIYEAAGALGRISFPAYSLDGGRHSPSSMLLMWLDASPNFQKVLDLRQLQAGDLLCFRSSRSEHHVGVLLDEGKIVHARERYGVEITGLDDPVYNLALAAAYRPLEIT